MDDLKHLAALAGVLLALVFSVPALAQSGDGPRRLERPRQGEAQEQRKPRRDTFTQRQHERRESDAGSGRLTQEERQQLRRDIREHGRSVYRKRQRRF
jgi:hypothetical protein